MPPGATTTTTTTSAASPGDLAPAFTPRTRTIRYAGLVLGALAAFAAFAAMPAEVPHEARVVAGVVVLMGTWWITEAAPLPVTALMPLVLLPAFGVTTMEELAPSYASQIIFLFLGGFLLALGIQRWGLHRRIALLVVLAVGTKPTRMVLGMMIATAVLGMWVSNTATALMMIPLGLSLVGLIEDQDGVARKSRFGVGLMLGIAYSATISAFGTIIATPGNVFVVGFIRENLGHTVTFLQWMVFGIPLVVVFLAAGWLVIAQVLWRPEIDELPGGRQLFLHELSKLGRMSAGEKLIALICCGAALSWILVPLVFEDPWATDAVIAMIAGLTTFLVPARPAAGVMVMDWDAAREIPWGTLILFGGGLALSGQVTATGLSDWVGDSFAGLEGLPFWLVLAVILVAVLAVTEITSSMATIATFVPIVAGVALGLGFDPVLLAILVTQACQCAFMLPVATAPNAIAFGSGAVSIRQMVRTGLWMNVIGFGLIFVLAFTLVPWALSAG
ncbi:DASS family sodium-coupled anion symporter [Rothia sp. AR01]|uniref:Sodium-dependent dicarboxylate transporter SdcS n=1 Tax=Rothia santali TaxID=2949643 RepID=A0A9X2KHE9_9MICC|nr:DASS family sodium-coupled anion symporter [Rothia santali]MCP3425767.1 DASS family sodium-coupled anion symporter [Rothia santali]